MDKVLLTTVEAAQALGIGRSKLYELLQTGRLASVRIGACRRIPAASVHRFVRVRLFWSDAVGRPVVCDSIV